MVSLSFRGPRKRTSVKNMRSPAVSIRGSVLIFTALILAAMTLLSSGCSSFPRKRTDQGSMLVFVQDIDDSQPLKSGQELNIQIEGPENAPRPLISLTPGRWRVHYLPFPAGRYTLLDPAGGPDYTVDLRKDTIRLIQAKAVLDPDTGLIIFGPVEPDDRKRVSEDMSDYLNFSEWIGSFYEGFGPYTPRFALSSARYEYTVTTDPEGGAVIIDGENWGESPITVQLEPGKHLVRIEKEGYVSIQTFITLESAGEITFELEPEAKKELTQEEGISKQFYTVLISPLRNIGDPEYDYLKTVFSDGIASGLYGREDVRVLMHPEDLPLSENLLSPDFSYAEQQGAELLVSGRFLAKGEKLFVHATLYDVLTQQVKTSTMYTGGAGLAMFESIDTMTEEFVDNMDRVLPKIGEEVVERKQTVTREIVTYEKKITDEQIVDERMKNRHSLALYYTWGATLDSGPLDTTFGSSRVGGPTSGFTVAYDLFLFQPLSLSVKTGMNFYDIWVEGYTVSQDTGIEVPLYVGPSLVFSGRRTDLTIGIDAHFHFIGGFSYDEGFGYVDFGPFLLIGASLDAGLKFYLNRRMSARPVFLSVGMLFDLYSRRFPLDFSGSELVPFSVYMLLGGGVRL